MSDTALQKIEQQPLEFSAFGNISHFENAQRMAKALASSSVVPTGYQGEQNLGNCIIALEISNRIGASVLAVMQNLYLVHGKPGWSSQFLISCVNASRKFTPLRYQMTGEKGKDTWGCIAWANDKGGEKLESPEVTIQMAKEEGWYGKNGSKWKTMPELMLRYRAATLFARLYAPELTMGIQTEEELKDVVDVEATVVTTSLPAGGPTFAKKTAPAVTVTAEPPPAPKKPTKPVEPKVVTPEPPPADPEPELPVQAEVVEPSEGDSPELTDLRNAIAECNLTDDKVAAFAARKGVLKEGADKDLATLTDIRKDKLVQLAKMIRQKGTAYKEMGGQ